jgi:CRP-like cAMP-binding protein
VNVFRAIVTRLQRPQTNRRILLVATCCIALAALIAYFLAEDLNPTSLTLFLVVAQPLIVVGVLLYLIALFADFLRHHGVSRVHFAPGEVIFRQGDPGDFVYTIIDGRVEVVREESAGEEKVINRLGAGEYFGEMALISNAPRTATVRATTEVDAVAIARDDFTALYMYLPDLHRSIEKVVKQRPVTVPPPR